MTNRKSGRNTCVIGLEILSGSADPVLCLISQTPGVIFVDALRSARYVLRATCYVLRATRVQLLAALTIGAAFVGVMCALNHLPTPTRPNPSITRSATGTTGRDCGLDSRIEAVPNVRNRREMTVTDCFAEQSVPATSADNGTPIVPAAYRYAILHQRQNRERRLRMRNRGDEYRREIYRTATLSPLQQPGVTFVDMLRTACRVLRAMCVQSPSWRRPYNRLPLRVRTRLVNIVAWNLRTSPVQPSTNTTGRDGSLDSRAEEYRPWKLGELGDKCSNQSSVWLTNE
ncbi:unnamed protein product [Rhizoctonia solani]|uniref:Uncharacterized protein n=1 Tax=Rhizoctonia solani TaxID=456999 RepID=A0A8H3HRJ3_9AGAM|nr:unnamed protein product [Rhizoctonia solani]